MTQPDDLDPMVKLKLIAVDLVNVAKEAQGRSPCSLGCIMTSGAQGGLRKLRG